MIKKEFILIGGFASLILFVIDRILKIIALEKLSFSGKFFIFSDWFSLDLAFNRGLIFGLELNYGLILLVYLAAFLVICRFLILAVELNKRAEAVFLFLIAVGAFSNFLDRLYLGSVVDYFNFADWNIFNLADAMIVVGVSGLLWVYFRVIGCRKETEF